MPLIWILLAVVLVPLGVGATAVLLTGRRPSTPTGLVFHSIRRTRRSHLSYVMVRTFETFLTRLESRPTTTRTLTDFAAAPPANRGVLLTFDDGLLDAYEHAFPLLERFGMKATFFPIAGAIGRRTDSDVFGPLRHASAEHLREIAARGHEIGSHSLTHADLTFLDREELERELRDSKRILEDILGHAVTSLSFPYGGWNDRVWQVARELGYERATVYRGRARIPEGLLPVLGVYAFDTVDDILRKAVGDMGPSVATARSRLMPQFARGTPLWRFRSIYRVGRPAGL